MQDFFNVITDILIQENTELSKETIKTYRFILSKFNRYFPEIKCDQISPQIICLFREKMLVQGNCWRFEKFTNRDDLR